MAEHKIPLILLKKRSLKEMQLLFDSVPNDNKDDNSSQIIGINPSLHGNFTTEEYLPFHSDNSSQINSSLSGNLTEEYLPHHARPETYIVPIIFALIFIIGVIGR